MLSGGEVKEIRIHTKTYADQDSVAICYKGKISSGMIELSKEEANELYKKLAKKIGLIKDIKISKE
jgi:hypothetical protein